jgi:UDP-N-acetylglucosamine 4,6-dehydratase
MPSLFVSGGTGFIGSLICKRLANTDEYQRIVVFSRDWHKQEELRETLGNNPKFRWFIGDILDKDRLKRALHRIDHVLHTAANKSLVDSQYSPREAALLNNCVGTQNMIDASIDCGVKKMLFISSDKAANPSSAYGASKNLGEHLTVAGNSYSPDGTKFSVARYGNVLKSSGSVGLVFERQKVSGVITITDPAMTRFWITPDAAVDFVLRCLREMVGGEIFIPKLPASRVVDLAKAIAPEAEIRITGIRPGEKLSEIMITTTESYRTKELEGDIFRIEPTFKFWDTHTAYAGGSPVPQDWTYSSASATRLSVEQLREMIG